MVRCICHLLTAWQKALPLTAGIAATALLSPVASASAATPLTGEVLTGTGTTSNWSSVCSPPAGYSNPAVNMSYTVSGQAKGQFAGTFVASGRAAAQGKQQFGAARAALRRPRFNQLVWA